MDFKLGSVSAQTPRTILISPTLLLIEHDDL